MTNQEKIREGMEEHIKACLKVSGVETSETFAKSLSISLLVILDGLGVVIKVAYTRSPNQEYPVAVIPIKEA